LATAILSAAVVWRSAAVAIGGCAVLDLGAVSLTVIDLDHQVLPDVITIPLLWLGLLASVRGTRNLMPPIPPIRFRNRGAPRAT